MRKYIFLIMFLFIFIISCADDKVTVYNYNDEANTLGLTVYPSNTLNFTSQDINTSKDFELNIDTNIIATPRLLAHELIISIIYNPLPIHHSII